MGWINAIPHLDFWKQTVKPSMASYSIPSHLGMQGEAGKDSRCVHTSGVVRWKTVFWDTPFPSPPGPIPALFTVFLADEEQKKKKKTTNQIIKRIYFLSCATYK